MIQNYTAVIQKSDGWWIGWIQEVNGVNCQERNPGRVAGQPLKAVLKILWNLTGRRQFVGRRANLLRKLRSHYETAIIDSISQKARLLFYS